jgi:hypothetical protein
VLDLLLRKGFGGRWWSTLVDDGHRLTAQRRPRRPTDGPAEIIVLFVVIGWIVVSRWASRRAGIARPGRARLDQAGAVWLPPVCGGWPRGGWASRSRPGSRAGSPGRRRPVPGRRVGGPARPEAPLRPGRRAWAADGVRLRQCGSLLPLWLASHVAHETPRSVR